MKFVKNKQPVEQIATPADHVGIIALRQQAFSHLEPDSIEEADLDPKNFLCVIKDGDAVVATGRLDTIDNNTFHITRVAVDEQYRNSGHGSHIVQILESQALQKSNNPKIKLKCLADNLEFYIKLEYEIDGDAFKEDNRVYYNLIKEIQSD